MTKKRFFAVSTLTTEDEKVTMEFFDSYTDAMKKFHSVGIACIEEIKENNEVSFMAGDPKLSINFYAFKPEEI